MDNIKKIENFFKEQNIQIKTNSTRSVPEGKNIFWRSGGLTSLDAFSELNILQVVDATGLNVEDIEYKHAFANYKIFCSCFPYVINPFLFKQYKQNKEYIFSKNEKILSFNEILQDYNITKFFENLSLSEEYINIINDNTIYGIPYQQVNNNDIKYYNPNILYHMNKDMGLGSGTTLDEALTQAVCDIYIKYCSYLLVNTYQDQKFYQVCNKILSQSLQERIECIESHYNKLFIFDLSYNYNLPVVLVLIYNQQCSRMHYAFGSHYNFETAIKLALYELYHGIYHHGIITNLQQPFRSCLNQKELLAYRMSKEASFNYTLPIQVVKYRDFIPEELLLNNELVTEYNKNIFNQNNLFLYPIYYHNYSLIDGIYAVHVYIPDLHFQNNQSEYIKKLDNNYKIKNKTFIYKLYNTIINYIDKNIYDTSIINDILNITQDDLLYIKELTFTDWLSPYIRENSNILLFIQDILNHKDIDLTYVQDIYTKTIFLYYKHLQKYIDSKQYSNKEILRLFALTNFNRAKKNYDIYYDLQNINNPSYLFEILCLKPLEQELTNPASIINVLIQARQNADMGQMQLKN